MLITYLYAYYLPLCLLPAFMLIIYLHIKYFNYLSNDCYLFEKSERFIHTIRWRILRQYLLDNKMVNMKAIDCSDQCD